MKKINELSGYLRRCIDDYGMINEGDRIAVGVSGGKDSMVLLYAMKYLQGYYPKKFHLEGITLDLGFEGMDFTTVKEFCRRISVPYTVIKTDIKEIVFDIKKEENPCSLCSKMRRGGLNTAMKERGLNKLALGHHFDDAVETFMMSLLYEGRISCFKPLTYMSRADVYQIRPMAYIPEEKVVNVADYYNVPIVHNPCPQDKSSKRHEIKSLIEQLSLPYPELKTKVFGAMQRLPLDGWGVEK